MADVAAVARATEQYFVSLQKAGTRQADIFVLLAVSSVALDLSCTLLSLVNDEARW